MDPRHLLTRLFASEFVRFISLSIAFLFLLAFGAAAWTGDWNIPVFLGILMIYFVFRTAIILGYLAYYFLPVPIAIIVGWAGYKLFIKKKRTKADNETSANAT